MTAVVVTVNVADVLPAATVTVVGAFADPLLLEIAMLRPPLGAATLIFTVPVDGFPPTTDAGFRLRETIVGGLTVSVAVSLTPFKLAWILATV